MAEDDAGVVRARFSVDRAVADAGDAVVDVDWIHASFVVMSTPEGHPVHRRPAPAMGLRLFECEALMENY